MRRIIASEMLDPVTQRLQDHVDRLKHDGWRERHAELMRKVDYLLELTGGPPRQRPRPASPAPPRSR
jgi:hypothetical protein